MIFKYYFNITLICTFKAIKFLNHPITPSPHPHIPTSPHPHINLFYRRQGNLIKRTALLHHLFYFLTLSGGFIR